LALATSGGHPDCALASGVNVAITATLMITAKSFFMMSPNLAAL